MSKRPYTIDEYVRWSDIDFAGIICYGAYLRFFELAETEIFREAGAPYGEVFDRFDVWLPRREIHCEFLYPARLDDELRVATYFSHIGRTSLKINFDVKHLGTSKLCAVAHQVLVCTGRSELRPTPLPPELISLIHRFHLTPTEARQALECVP